MIKVIALGKRKPGMSFEDFVDYYKNKHSKLGESVLKRVGAVHYKRNYVVPASNAFHGDYAESDFDVVVEFGFPDRVSFEACFDIVGNELRDTFVADEENFADRDAIRMLLVVEEDESDLSQA